MTVSVWKNIGVMRGVGILLVVLSHSVRSVVNVRATVLGSIPYGSLETVGLIAGVTLPFVSIAAFMIAAGYFMARFSGTVTTALASAKVIGGRYLLWSIAGYSLLLLLEHHYTLHEAYRTLPIYFGPFPGYWFFPTMLFTLLLCPWLSGWALTRPRAVVSGIVALEAIRATIYYWELPYSLHVIPLGASYFLMGMLLAKHTDAILNVLIKHRRLLGYACLLTTAIALLETTWQWQSHGWTERLASSDRFSVRVFSVLAVAWFIAGPTKATPTNARINDIGMKSLPVLLMFDLFQHFTQVIGWHLPKLLGGTSPMDGSLPPRWLVSPSFVPIYFAVGLAGPVFTVWAAERVLGKRHSRFLFG